MHLSPSLPLSLVPPLDLPPDLQGWLKTVDEYSTGMRNDIQRAGVTNIIST